MNIIILRYARILIYFKIFEIFCRSSKSDTALRALAGFQTPRAEKTRTASGPPVLPDDLSTPTTEAEVHYLLKLDLSIIKS